MSELQLKSHVERMKKQCNAECNVGRQKLYTENPFHQHLHLITHARNKRLVLVKIPRLWVS